MTYPLTMLAHHVQAAPGYTCPKSRNDLWTQIQKPVNIVVGDILGLRPLVVFAVIGIAILLAILSFIPAVRKTLLPALLWVVGASIGAGILIALVVSLLGNFGC